MEKYYSINDLSEMTGLSDRTIRNYIKAGLLVGEKIDGAWKFTAENYGDFITNPNVFPSIRAKKNALVYDFMLDTKKKEAEICSIIDIPAEHSEAMAIAKFFCDAANETEGVSMNFEHKGKFARVMVSGEAEEVVRIISEFYKK